MDGRQRPETAGDSAVVFKTSATLRKAKCQLRLTRSGMPSRVSLRRHWIFSKLKARFNRFENYSILSLPLPVPARLQLPLLLCW